MTLPTIDPCPNCDETECYVIPQTVNGAQVECGSCGMHGPAQWTDRDVILLWNGLPRR